MSEWMCWVLLILGVAAICFLGWWLTTVLSVWTCIYITIILNGIVMCYNMIQSGKRKNR